jgi:hypothetical protein
VGVIVRLEIVEPVKWVGLVLHVPVSDIAITTIALKMAFVRLAQEDIMV